MYGSVSIQSVTRAANRAARLTELLPTFYDAEENPVRTILTNFKDRYTATATANGKTLSTNYPLAVITYGET